MVNKDSKSSLFSSDNQPERKKDSLGTCPFRSGKYVIDFSGGHYIDVSCMGAGCHLWSVKYGCCKLGLNENVVEVLNRLFKILSVLP